MVYSFWPSGYATDISAISNLTPDFGGLVYLLDNDRRGLFTWVNGNFVTEVSIDLGKGIYIPSSSIDPSIGVYVRLITDNKYNVKWFGAKGDGTNDDTNAIKTAVALLPANGGIVYFPPGVYCISDTITLGNGNLGTTPSTRNGIKLNGEGAGFASYGARVPTVIQWIGGTTTAPMVTLAGQICDVEIKGIFFDCQSKCSGLQLIGFSGSNFEQLKILRPAANRYAIQVKGGNSPTGNYNIYNSFSRISVSLFNPNSVGLLMDGVYSVSNDTWLTKFDTVRIETVAGATNAVCAWFKFVDSCTFHRCHFESTPEPTSTGLILDALANDGFPSGIGFYDCSIKNIVVYEDSTHHIRKQFFANHGTYDNEILPNHPMLVGYTDQGLWFGPIGYTSGAGGSVTQTTNKGTAVTLNKLTGNIIMNNAALSANTSISFIFNNSFISSNDLVVLNITGGATYGAYSIDISDVQNGLAVISLRNNSGSSLSEAINIGFAIIKGSNV